MIKSEKKSKKKFSTKRLKMLQAEKSMITFTLTNTEIYAATRVNLWQ